MASDKQDALRGPVVQRTDVCAGCGDPITGAYVQRFAGERDDGTLIEGPTFHSHRCAGIYDGREEAMKTIAAREKAAFEAAFHAENFDGAWQFRLRDLEGEVSRCAEAYAAYLEQQDTKGDDA